MVSHKQIRIQKRTVKLSQGRNVAKLCKYTKLKKKVTWDKTIALRQEELWELENERRGPKEASPVVTFIGKHYPQNGSEDPHTFNSHNSRPIQVTIFNLEDGRVDVPEVLSYLGASQVEIEEEPGVWNALEGLTSGKSKSKFKCGEVVFFRIVPEIQSSGQNLFVLKKDKSHVKCRSDVSNKQVARVHPELSLQKSMLKGKWIPWVDNWIVAGDTLEDYYGRVGRLIEDRREQGGGLCGIGIVVRLAFHHKHTRLLVTCRHMVAQEGEPNLVTRGKLYAFGGPVKLLHTSKKYDLALLQGPLLPGTKGFDLAPEGEEQPGREVRLVTFPWYLDNVWGQLPLKEVQPAELPGRISYLSEGQQNSSKPCIVDALATYMGGLPGCSGGAVTLNSRILCGVHSGVYPLKTRTDPPRAIFVAKEDLPSRQKYRRSKSTKATSNNMAVSRPPRFSNKGKMQSLQLRASPMFTQCSSTHGYLAVYVSSSHIRETCLEWYAKPAIKKILDSLLEY